MRWCGKKHCRAVQATNNNMLMDIARVVAKATDTHS